ncbi:aKG-HExxH-type peptide beta-hydroxylase [Streptomyces himalayensis]|uniref:YcaO-like family protein n=1 Tax=Streptomyces himalayensis subsp. himalayensis TaxID=2756131 RepID=A0A7W0IEA5_9ACTN|nr:HEXXH motif-containing putative peptide modification protein [Streptomyces himalayensis]MBA2951921.1 YcaO-like family protein [Streptomyces himalayensis subsp. himalayensis]
MAKEELVVLARSVRRLSPAGVHRFFTLAKSPPSPDEGPGIAELFRAGAVDGAATTVLEQTDEPWVRDGLAQAVASLGGTEDDPAPVLVGFPVALRPALERARAALELAWPEAWEEHHALIRYLVYADAPQLRSATTGSTFGAVYVGVDEAADPLRMFQVLLHETGHHALDLRDKFTGFLANPDAMASHPLRNDPRPLRGVLHAAFALWRMAEGLRRYAHYRAGGHGRRPSRRAPVAGAVGDPGGPACSDSPDPRQHGRVDPGRRAPQAQPQSAHPRPRPSGGPGAHGGGVVTAQAGLFDKRVDRSTDDAANLADRWGYAAEWEMLELADGSIVFHHLKGRQFTLRDPGEGLRGLLRRLDAGAVSPLELAGQDREAAKRLMLSLAPLIRTGILVTDLEDRVTAIAGARDDIGGMAFDFAAGPPHGTQRRTTCTTDDALEPHLSAAGATVPQRPDTELARLVDRCARLGSAVLRADLTHPRHGVPVVRVVAPGLAFAERHNHG